MTNTQYTKTANGKEAYFNKYSNAQSTLFSLVYF